MSSKLLSGGVRGAVVASAGARPASVGGEFADPGGGAFFDVLLGAARGIALNLYNVYCSHCWEPFMKSSVARC